MIYLLSFIAGLNIVILVELCSQAIVRQEAQGKEIAYGKTWIIYIVFVLIVAAIVYGIARFLRLG
jgi:hypothetical protein